MRSNGTCRLSCCFPLAVTSTTILLLELGESLAWATFIERCMNRTGAAADVSAGRGRTWIAKLAARRGRGPGTCAIRTPHRLGIGGSGPTGDTGAGDRRGQHDCDSHLPKTDRHSVRTHSGLSLI